MAKRKFRLVTLILSGLAALCTLLVMVSCFLPYYQADMGLEKNTTVTPLQQLTESYTTEEYMQEIVKTDNPERAARLTLIQAVINKEEALTGSAMMFMAVPMLLFGFASFICSICGMFVSGKMGAMILNILNLLFAGIFFAGSLIVAQQVEIASLGAGAIMALVFGVLALGLSIAAVATRKSKKEQANI